jgi:hypothetical protein
MDVLLLIIPSSTVIDKRSGCFFQVNQHDHTLMLVKKGEVPFGSMIIEYSHLNMPSRRKRGTASNLKMEYQIFLGIF